MNFIFMGIILGVTYAVSPIFFWILVFIMVFGFTGFITRENHDD